MSSLRPALASMVGATATVVIASVLVTRREPPPALVAACGGMAVVTAFFAFATATHGRRVDLPRPVPREKLRLALDSIVNLSQAGTIGDADAAQYAFAMIARRTREVAASLDD